MSHASLPTTSRLPDIYAFSAARVAEWLRQHSLDKYMATLHVDGRTLAALSPAQLGDVPDDGDHVALFNALEAAVVSPALRASVTVEDFVCAVCMEVLDAPVLLPCGHWFDSACITHWSAASATCPVDRTPLPTPLPPVLPVMQRLIARKFPGHVRSDGGSRTSVTSGKAAEAARRQAEERASAAGIAQLKRHFRQGALTPDESVLAAVLDMCGSVTDAIAFLKGQGQGENAGYELATLASSAPALPRDYSVTPAGMVPLAPAAVPDTLAVQLKLLLTGERSTYTQHLEAQTRHRTAYLALLRVLMERRVELSHGSKARALAAAWARRDEEMTSYVLGGAAHGLLGSDSTTPDVFGLADVLKALRILDTPRAIRQKVGRLHCVHCIIVI